MRARRFAAWVVLGMAGVAGGSFVSPLATADSCDPSATVCQGLPTQPTVSSPDYAPSVSAPNDSTWYFNPNGGGTALHNNNNHHH
jgi:hypothetical protein